jgi:hypothetical protein
LVTIAVKHALNVHRRVRIAMSVLTPGECEAVNRVIDSYRSFIEYTADPERVKTIEAPGQQLSLLSITPGLRLVYTATAEGIAVLDLVEQATLDFFAAKRHRKTGAR